MGYAPPQVVAPIDRTPVKYGLMSVLTERPTDDPHWQNGITWESLGCAPASGVGEPVCPPTQILGLPFNIPRGTVNGTGNPFTVYEAYVCGTFGHDNPLEYAKMRATALLEAREVQRVEQAIWTGDLHDGANSVGNPGFAPGATIIGGGALSLRYAISLLEQEMTRTYGSQPVLHMTRAAANIGCADFTLDTFNDDGSTDGMDLSTLRTQLNTPVVAGVGYPGTAPDGSDPGIGKTYIYATPALAGYRSDILAIEPTVPALSLKNDLEAVAQRTWLVTWDVCTPLGVLVDLNAFA